MMSSIRTIKEKQQAIISGARTRGRYQGLDAGSDDVGAARARLVGRTVERQCFALAYRRLDITNQLVQRARFCAHARMWSRQLVSHSAAQSHIWFSPGRGLGHAPVCVVS